MRFTKTQIDAARRYAGARCAYRRAIDRHDSIAESGACREMVQYMAPNDRATWRAIDRVVRTMDTRLDINSTDAAMDVAGFSGAT